MNNHFKQSLYITSVFCLIVVSLFSVITKSIFPIQFLVDVYRNQGFLMTLLLVVFGCICICFVIFTLWIVSEINEPRQSRNEKTLL